MKVFIMTDIEGVCGIVRFDDWAVPGGTYYEEGRQLLTLEVNAAVDGFLSAGATEIWVVDGHGPGAINLPLLDPRVQYLRGPQPGPYPFMLDRSFDCMAWVGQHAKAGAEYAQMAHTGSFQVLDDRINGLSVGEFAQIALCGAELGVRSIFGSGDEAFAKEASALIAGIETVSVKRGLMPGSGDEFNDEGYKQRNNGAIHMHPEKARERIRAGAARAMRRFIDNPEQFTLPQLKPPYRRTVTYRSKAAQPAKAVHTEHPDSIISLLNIR